MRPLPAQYPKTCGEFRGAAAAGKDFLYGRQMFQILGTVKGYENLWRVWGLDKRPAEFPDKVSDGLPDVFPHVEEPQWS